MEEFDITKTILHNLKVPVIDWTWTGFSKKTLWDWMSLLIVPAVLATVGIAFNFAITRNERNIAQDNQQETLLQSYLDKMSELLLHENLRLNTSKPSQSPLPLIWAKFRY